ncbi:hypothetical protein VFA_002898 [Vibrio furnissii CIP 102972]|nr:hypothetical protein VFA_002898 [Vibrio furnissii CIP 102972]
MIGELCGRTPFFATIATKKKTILKNAIQSNSRYHQLIL